MATGRLDQDTVAVEDTADANRLHNKSLAGIPETGNTLRLHRVEATYCMERGWLKIPGTSATDLLAAGATEGEQLEVDHLCYRDLRDRGLAVRIQGDTMDVWNRGTTRKEAAWFTTHALSERVPIAGAELANLAGDHVSIVDEDGAVTHYTTNAAVISGDWHNVPAVSLQGILLDDRVLVANAQQAKALAEAAFGTPHGDGRILSLVEAEALRRKGVLSIDDGLANHARSRQPDFDATLAVYETLASAGVLAKSGFRFGTHLRGYASHPEKSHAEWLLHCIGPGAALSWSDLSRGIRLAHGVRKRFIVAIAETPVRFIELAWFRP
jgi:tRNA-intron endonuclease